MEWEEMASTSSSNTSTSTASSEAPAKSNSFVSSSENSPLEPSANKPEVKLATPAETEKELMKAKSYLLRTSTLSGMNLYDHLARMLGKILEQKPNEVVANFEKISLDTKREQLIQKSVLTDVTAKPSSVLAAENEVNLFKRETKNVDLFALDDNPLPDVMQLAYYFEMAGVGLSSGEYFRIWMALQTLTDQFSLQHMRFWGKVFGTEQNYYIAEVEYKSGEEEENEESAYSDTSPNSGPIWLQGDDILRPTYRHYVTPTEKKGTGLNKMTYLVCNEPGKPWQKLPPVTPAQIVAARTTRKFFTGRLDAPVYVYPHFPGNEANFLRAQIARIGASTHIAPMGFYTEEAAEEESDDGPAVQIEIPAEGWIKNRFFEPVSVSSLASTSLSYWVHIGPYILPQGCVSLHRRSTAVYAESEDEEPVPEEHDILDELQNPPLLSPLYADEKVDGHPAWTPHASSSLIPEHSIASMHSNLWPGAHSFAVGKKFENIYIGWALKYTTENYNPPLPVVMNEYPEALHESNDPTPQEEKKHAETHFAGADEERSDQGDDEDDSAY